MTKQLTLVGIMLGALAMPAMAARNGDRDRSPEAITRRSIHRIQRVTARSVRTMRRHARRCAMEITQLLENEESDRAAEVADRCIGGINRVAERGGEMIRIVVDRAVSVLRELEAPVELAEAVENAGRRGSGAIREHRAGAIQVVEEALAGSPPE